MKNLIKTLLFFSILVFSNICLAQQTTDPSTKEVQITIASGADTSSTVQLLYGLRVALIKIPSTFTGTTISILTSIDGVNYTAYKPEGIALQYPVAAGDIIGIPLSDSINLEYFRIVASTQSEARVITLTLLKVL